jgi:hypothetical protein
VLKTRYASLLPAATFLLHSACSEAPEPAAKTPDPTWADVKEALIDAISDETPLPRRGLEELRRLRPELRQWNPGGPATTGQWCLGAYTMTINLARRRFVCLQNARYPWHICGDFRLRADGTWSAVITDAKEPRDPRYRQNPDDD